MELPELVDVRKRFCMAVSAEVVPGVLLVVSLEVLTRLNVTTQPRRSGFHEVLWWRFVLPPSTCQRDNCANVGLLLQNDMMRSLSVRSRAKLLAVCIS